MDIIELVKKEVDKATLDNDVILFGSRARGDNTADSDWDILVLLGLKELTRSEKQHIKDRIYEVELLTGQVITPLIHTRASWNARSVTPLYRNVTKEGRAA